MSVWDNSGVVRSCLTCQRHYQLTRTHDDSYRCPICLEKHAGIVRRAQREAQTNIVGSATTMLPEQIAALPWDHEAIAKRRAMYHHPEDHLIRTEQGMSLYPTAKTPKQLADEPLYTKVNHA